MLSNNLRTHIVILRDGRKFNITTDQYATLKLNREDLKRTAPLEIRDCDTKELLYDGEMGDIKEFQERKQDEWLQQARFVCAWWSRHPLSQGWECNCSKEFNCMWFQMKDRLLEMWYKIDYDNDITEQMQFEYKKKYL